MMNEDALNELTRQIMEQGYDREIAGRYAYLIGDTPISDGQGNILVMDGKGQFIATLKPLKIFS